MRSKSLATAAACASSRTERAIERRDRAHVLKGQAGVVTESLSDLVTQSPINDAARCVSPIWAIF